MASKTSAEQNCQTSYSTTRQAFGPAPYQASQQRPLYRLERLYVPPPPWSEEIMILASTLGGQSAAQILQGG